MNWYLYSDSLTVNYIHNSINFITDYYCNKFQLTCFMQFLSFKKLYNVGPNFLTENNCTPFLSMNYLFIVTCFSSNYNGTQKKIVSSNNTLNDSFEK